MKVYHFALRVAVTSDADETLLLERLRHFTIALSGDAFDSPSIRQQAKLALKVVTSPGDDPVDPVEWHDQACRSVGKAHAADYFLDPREPGQRANE